MNRESKIMQETAMMTTPLPKIELGIDIETRSDANLKKVGSYRYCAAPTFDILLITYKFSDEPGDDGYKTIDLTKYTRREKKSPEFIHSEHERFWTALADPSIIKTAWNVSFERVALTRWLYEYQPLYLYQGERNTDVYSGKFNALGEVVNYSPEKWPLYMLPPNQWSDTMILAAHCGLPRSLKNAGSVLLPPDQQKMKEGGALIRKFCTPRKRRKSDPEDAGIVLYQDPTDPKNGKDWETFKRYNKQDVVTEQSIRKIVWKLYYEYNKDRSTEDIKKANDAKKRERKLWIRDQEINDYGVRLDRELADKIVRYSEGKKQDALCKASKITGLSNPNSVQQLCRWLAKKGVDVTDPETDKPSLTKAKVKELLSQEDLDPDVRRVLEIRQETGKASIKKFQTMLDMTTPQDPRARGILSFYGAPRTGRWAGKFLQPQNLAKNHMADEDLDAIRELAKTAPEKPDGSGPDFSAFEAYCKEHELGDPTDALSQLVRTGFVPSDGHEFVVSDFSAIEARVIAWMTATKWRLDTFEQGGDIYCESASQMFGVPVVKNGVNGELRAQGKVAELACIAEGSLVQTKRGLVPIEQVKMSDRIWDGEHYVKHGGVKYQGVRPVITYDNLSATWDHRVFVEGREKPVLFWSAARQHLKLRRGHKDKCPKTYPLTGRSVRVFDIKNCGPNHCYCVQGRIVHNCGYGGGVGAMKKMDFNHVINSDQKYREIVDAWRKRSPRIPEHWRIYEDAAKKAIELAKPSNAPAAARQENNASIEFHRPKDNKNKMLRLHETKLSTQTAFDRSYKRRGDPVTDNAEPFDVIFRVEKIMLPYRETPTYILKIQLPSGREIWYWNTKNEEDPDPDHQNWNTLSFMGTDQTKKKWEKIETYGGKITENIVQATARDILGVKMKKLEEMGYRVVFHIHDEMIIDAPKGKKEKDHNRQAVDNVMKEPVQWAPGLPLKGDTYTCAFYRKD